MLAIILEGGKKSQRAWEKMLKFEYEYAFKQDGKATERILRLIRSMME